MSKLIDIINNKPMLKRLYRMLELGIGTADWKLLQPHIIQFDIDGVALTSEHLTQLQKQVNDDMVSQGYSQRDVNGLSNIISIYGTTAINVQTEAKPQNDVSIGFASKFYDYARGCYDKEKHDLSVKILAKELSKPNSYYLRTLDVFFMADKFEIDWFFDISKYIFDQACIPEFILTDNRFYPFNQFQTLTDAGFINSTTGSMSFNNTNVMHFPTAEVKVEIPKPPVILGIYTLTDAGAQLCDLCEADTNDDYLEKLKEVLEKRQAKVISIERK